MLAHGVSRGFHFGVSLSPSVVVQTFPPSLARPQASFGEARCPPSFADILANFGVTSPKPWRRREAPKARKRQVRLTWQA